jgi:hypothetical protein
MASTAPSSFAQEITVPIVEFLNRIGVKTFPGTVPDDTFVPGIDVRGGELVYEEAKLKYPGDLLHEAGHLAVMTPEERSAANATVDTGPGEEMAAIAWSYAAALQIGIDPAVVFHAEGYKGGSQAILTSFTEGHYFGVPLLVWMGLTNTDKTPGGSYPRMAQWLRR